MHLTIQEGLAGDVEFAEGAPLVSAHTGHPLRKGVIHLRVAREHDALMAALPGRVLDSHEGRWLVVRRPHWSYRDGADVAEHEFEIEEFENRMATRLRISDLELTPEKYHEQSQGDGLKVRARVALTDATQIDRLRRILASDESVPIIREGVQPTPRIMRASVLGWSNRGAEHVFELEFAEPYDAKPRPLTDWNGVMGGAAREAHVAEWLTGFGELLVEKGVASREEVDQVKESARQNIGQRLVNFMEVNDVREHPFSNGDED